MHGSVATTISKSKNSTNGIELDKHEEDAGPASNGARNPIFTQPTKPEESKQEPSLAKSAVSFATVSFANRGTSITPVISESVVPAMTERLHVLVVDDSSMSSRIVSKKLESLHCEVQTAHNGKIALEMMKSHSFQLVLADVVMPICDGLTLLNLMKLDQALVNIPVILISGLDDNNLLLACMERGAKAVMQKPFNVRAFKDITKTLNLHIH